MRNTRTLLEIMSYVLEERNSMRKGSFNPIFCGKKVCKMYIYESSTFVVKELKRWSPEAI